MSAIISLKALDALDAALSLAADVLDGVTPATPEEQHDLAIELCKGRGMVIEARDALQAGSVKEDT